MLNKITKVTNVTKSVHLQRYQINKSPVLHRQLHGRNAHLVIILGQVSTSNICRYYKINSLQSILFWRFAASNFMGDDRQTTTFGNLTSQEARQYATCGAGRARENDNPTLMLLFNSRLELRTEFRTEKIVTTIDDFCCRDETCFTSQTRSNTKRTTCDFATNGGNASGAV